MAELLRDVQGEDIITNALVDLVNQYPKLETGETIKFGTLSESGGISFFLMSGAYLTRFRSRSAARTLRSLSL